MGKMTFIHSVMNAGKSTHLLQVAHNYERIGSQVVMLTSALDNRSGSVAKITSGLGLEAPAQALDEYDNPATIVLKKPDPVACVLVDEAQFLTPAQVRSLASLVDEHGIDVMCFGLKSNAFGHLFEGSEALMVYADSLEEIRSLCFCGHKASMNLRFDEHFRVVTQGESICVGSEERYMAVCRQHFLQAQATGQLPCKPSATHRFQASHCA